MKTTYKLILFLTLLISVVGCIKRADEVSLVESVTIKVAYPAEEFKDVSFVGKEVKLVGQKEYKTVTNSEGEAIFKNVLPGIYNFSISQAIPKEEYGNLINTPLENRELVVNGVVPNIVAYTSQQKELVLQLGVKQSILISKVYYATCKDNLNKNYAVDQYIELYNNADEEVKIENLYMALLETESTPYFYADRYEFLAAKDVFQIPNQTVQPGQSIVIARRGINHKEFAALSVDLSTADYECKEIKNMAFWNPDIAALPQFYASIASIDYMNLLVGGGNQVVLFNYDGVVADLEKIQKPGASASAAKYLKIPSKMIIDGVECLAYKDVLDLSKRRLPEAVDATYITLSISAGRNNECVERKVLRFVDGRAILKDTNNSLEDFTTTFDPTPRIYTKPELQPTQE